jgi:outer membrane protein
MISKRLVFVLLFGFLAMSSINGQSTWSLQKCIDHALNNSLQVQASEYNMRLSEVNLMQSRNSRYPDLSANSNIGWNFGRSVDPTNNDFITETFFNNGFGLNSSVSIYNGGKINQSIKQAQTNAMASRSDMQQTQSNIALNVASIYLNTLLAKESLKNARKQLEITTTQGAAIQKQIAVGNRPENDMLDIQAQIAQNEQAIVDGINAEQINLLNLKQWLRLSPDEALDIEIPTGLEVTLDPDIITFSEVYASALKQQSSVEAAQLRVESAQIGEKIAKADYLPSFGGGLSARTNFSNKGRELVGFQNDYEDIDITFNGTPTTIGFPVSQAIFKNSTYFNQVSDNLSYGIGFQLNIPIYNNSVTKANVQRSQINTDRAKNDLDQVKETLKITVGQAIADAKAAKARYNASQKTLTAQENLYNNAIKRFDTGAINTFELTRLKSQMEASSINLINAKYEYLFRTKVIEFYLGRAIKL